MAHAWQEPTLTLAMRADAVCLLKIPWISQDYLKNYQTNGSNTRHIGTHLTAFLMVIQISIKSNIFLYLCKKCMHKFDPNFATDLNWKLLSFVNARKCQRTLPFVKSIVSIIIIYPYSFTHKVNVFLGRGHWPYVQLLWRPWFIHTCPSHVYVLL